METVQNPASELQIHFDVSNPSFSQKNADWKTVRVWEQDITGPPAFQ